MLIIRCCTDCLFDGGECDGCGIGTGECGPAYCDQGCLTANVGDGMCDLACLNSTKCSADNGDCDGCVRPRVHINVADDDDADMDVYQPLVQVGDSASGELLRPAGGSGVQRAPGIGHALYGDAFAGSSYATSRRGRATLPVGATELRRRRGAVVCAWLRSTPTRGPCLRRSLPKRYELRVADAVRVCCRLKQTAHCRSRVQFRQR